SQGVGEWRGDDYRCRCAAPDARPRPRGLARRQRRWTSLPLADPVPRLPQPGDDLALVEVLARDAEGLERPFTFQAEFRSADGLGDSLLAAVTAGVQSLDDDLRLRLGRSAADGDADRLELDDGLAVEREVAVHAGLIDSLADLVELLGILQLQGSGAG